MTGSEVLRPAAPPDSDSRRLPSAADGYELVEQIGSGSGTGGTVFRAMCAAIDDEVAIRIIDLDELTASLEDISRDIKVMSLSSHPNVVPFSTCFVAGNDLWVVMPLLTGGSVNSLLACHYQEKGLPPKTAVYILHSTLKALDYFHANNQIHRDVRAANILLDAHGQVMLSDYGMMGWMVEGGWEKQQRQTFVGTPCWMAPEVMEQTGGYDYKADIWSLGITAIELATGDAPYANYPPMKVLIMTMKNPSPTITGRAAEIFPEVYKEFLALCLEKDPSMRPSAKELLDHPLFKDVARPSDLESVLASLPPLGSRGGTTQRELYRRMQKAIAPPGSGLWSRRKGEGWDFSDDEDEAAPFGLLPGADHVEASTSSTPAPDAIENGVSERSVITAGLPPTLPSAISASRSFPSTDEGISIHAATGGIGDLPLHPMTPTDVMSRTTASATPGTTPSVTPGNPMSTPILSPPTEGEGRVSLPPAASAGDPSGAPMSALPSAVAHGVQASNGGGLPSLPNKGGGMQKKGRFTVSDVDVSAPDKLHQKLNTFIEDDMEFSATASQNTSNSAGGAISNSSSFTSIPAPSTETSPTSAVQTAAPVSGRAVLPAGIDNSGGQSGAGSGPQPQASKEQTRSKARFEVAPIDGRVGGVNSAGGGGAGGGGTNAPVKSRSRVGGRQHVEGTSVGIGVEPPGGTNSSSGAAPSGSTAPYSKSPKASPPSAGPVSTGGLSSMRSRESIPTQAVRPHPGASPPLQAAHSGGISVVQAYNHLVTTLGLECESLKAENDSLRRELSQLRSTHESDLVASRNQVLQQQQQLFLQQAQHDKLIQQLLQKVSQLQRTEPQSSHQPAQVKVLGQSAPAPTRSQTQAQPHGRVSQGQGNQTPPIQNPGSSSGSSTAPNGAQLIPQGRTPHQPTGGYASLSGQQNPQPLALTQPPMPPSQGGRQQQVSRQAQPLEQPRQAQATPASIPSLPQSQGKVQGPSVLSSAAAAESLKPPQASAPQSAPPQQSVQSGATQQVRQPSANRPPVVSGVLPAQSTGESKGVGVRLADPLEAALAGTSPPLGPSPGMLMTTPAALGGVAEDNTVSPSLTAGPKPVLSTTAGNPASVGTGDRGLPVGKSISSLSPDPAPAQESELVSPPPNAKKAEDPRV